jgi:hypothetical protein
VVDPEAHDGDDLDGDGEIGVWEVDRLCSVEVGGATLDPARTYRVATIDFLYSGGDHQASGIGRGRVVSTGPWLRDAVTQWLGGLGRCVAIEGAGADPQRISREPCKARGNAPALDSPPVRR